MKHGFGARRLFAVMTVFGFEVPDRAKAAVAAVLLQGLLGYGLILGLAPGVTGRVMDSIAVFDVTPEPVAPPVKKVVPLRAKAPRPKGRASAANLKVVPTIVVAPVPIVPMIVVPPIVAAPVAGDGAAGAAGAAAVIGPGTGAGGEGTGLGSGDAGDGDGGGGGMGSRWLKGRIRNADYPREVAAAGVEGNLTTRYVIGANGRVTGCSVTETSGNAVLDAVTCRLVIERYRYRPARDARGKKVGDVVYEDHSWVIAPER